MNDKKQKLLLEYLISSSDTYALCSSIVKSRYFDPEFRGAIDFIHKYYDEFHKTPTPEQIEAESGGVKLTERQVTSDQLEYTTNEIEKFCKERAIEAAITDSTPLISKGDFGGIETLIRNAVTVSLNRNMGTDYFRDPDGRLKKMSETGKKISTGWKELDKWLYGGMERGQLIIFSANSGGGKSVALSNLGLNFLEMGLNVVYFSFELSEDLISQRYDTMVSGIQTAVWEYHKGEISQAVLTAGDKNGHLLIREMYAGTKPNELRAYLKEYELLYSRTPDLIIVDYLDIMNPNERVSADNVFEKDKRVSEQIRDIGKDYNAVVASASQQNRGAVEEDRIHQGHVAGGISKVNTSDVWISVHASPTMRAKEECAFQLVKTRSSDGEGQMIYLDWTKTIRIKDRGGNAKKGLTLKKDAKPWIENGEEVKQNKGLLDLIDD
jgi:archaellum biogenesis ATPase FlaH